MTVILPQEAEEYWLGTAIDDLAVLTSFFRPFPPGAMMSYEASTWGDPPVNGGSSCATGTRPHF